MSDKGTITGSEPTVAVPTGESLPPAPSSPALTGEHHVFAGRYQILGLLGSGGMGTRVRLTLLTGSAIQT
jgi:hypothetical protein